MKNLTSLGIVSCLLLAVLASANTHLDDRELGIGDYMEQASVDQSRPDDKELGIGEYMERT